MADHFTARFIDDPEAFRRFHEQMEMTGYVTEDQEPYLNRPAHNGLNEQRYQAIFELHYPSHYTEIRAAATAFDIGEGFRSFYVAYDSTRFEGCDEVGRELKRMGILK